MFFTSLTLFHPTWTCSSPGCSWVVRILSTEPRLSLGRFSYYRVLYIADLLLSYDDERLTFVVGLLSTEPCVSLDRFSYHRVLCISNLLLPQWLPAIRVMLPWLPKEESPEQARPKGRWHRYHLGPVLFECTTQLLGILGRNSYQCPRYKFKFRRLSWTRGGFYAGTRSMRCGARFSCLYGKCISKRARNLSCRVVVYFFRRATVPNFYARVPSSKGDTSQWY